MESKTLDVILMESDDVLDFINSLDEPSKRTFLDNINMPRFIGAYVTPKTHECVCVVVFNEGLKGVRGQYNPVSNFLRNAVSKKIITREELGEILDFFYTTLTESGIFV